MNETERKTTLRIRQVGIAIIAIGFVALAIGFLTSLWVVIPSIVFIGFGIALAGPEDMIQIIGRLNPHNRE